MKKSLLLLSLSISSFVSFGQTWTTQNTSFAIDNRGIQDIQIVNATTVWAQGYDGAAPTNIVQEFTRTSDGGTTWTSGLIEVGDSALGINGISAVSATTAWVNAVNPTDGTGSVIYKTTDGGVTWAQQNATGFTAATSFIDGLHFFNANEGVAYGDPLSNNWEVYRTTNAGTTWTAVTGIPPSIGAEAAYNSKPVYSGNSLWFGTSTGKIYRTNDKGVTWTRLNSPVNNFSGGTAIANGATLIFSSPLNGALLKVAGTAVTWHTTTDGGTTWSAGIPYAGGTNRNISYVPGTNIVIATGGAGSLKSLDNGTTFTAFGGAGQKTANAFLDATTGWTGGFNTVAAVGGIFKLTGALGINSFDKESKNFGVYPNPTNGLVNISSLEAADYKLKVSDLTGKVLLEKSLNGIDSNVDVTSLSTGAYFFTLSASNKTETFKVIKN